MVYIFVTFFNYECFCTKLNPRDISSFQVLAKKIIACYHGRRRGQGWALENLQVLMKYTVFIFFILRIRPAAPPPPRTPKLCKCMMLVCKYVNLLQKVSISPNNKISGPQGCQETRITLVLFWLLEP